MLIGVPKEIKNNEFRVGMTPSGAQELVQRGHTVMVETQAGVGIGFSDEDYQNSGAQIVNTAAAIFEQAEMIVKVKEPQSEERKMLCRGQILFTYLHLAPDLIQTQELLASGAICIAYETVTDASGGFPLLAPMSEVAGRMAIQAGASGQEKVNGGSGRLLGGIPGVAPANVVILGGGVVGSNAARMAVGLHANVTILDNNVATLRRLDSEFQGRVNLIYSTSASIEEKLIEADLVIGGVLVGGAKAPKLIKKQHLKKMKAGAVIVDVAIDQGGCAETSHPTTHDAPMYIVDGVVHYCVTNMPGAVARTATLALNNATLPYIIQLADHGYQQALLNNPYFLNGLNVIYGKLTCSAVATAHNLPYVAARTALMN